MSQIFILNEKANNEKNLFLEDKLALLIKDIAGVIEKTTSLEDLKDVLTFYKNRADVIYAVGGDGTVNTILNGMFDGSASLGIIPVGTGNDFYKKLNEYNSEVLDVNVMRVNERLGINSFSIGLDAEIGINANLMKKMKIPSHLVYIASMFYTFVRYQNKEVSLDDSFKSLTLLALCNGTYYGGGFAISPEADITESSLCVYSLNGVSKVEQVKFLLQLLGGRHQENPNLDFFKTEDGICISSIHPLIGQLDGELMEDTCFSVTPSVGRIKVVNNKTLIKKLR